MPAGWCDDRQRCYAIGIPQEIGFKTKPALALKMLNRAFEHVLKPEWGLADFAYGNDGKFRAAMEERSQPYVVAVSKSHCIWLNGRQIKAKRLAGNLRGEEWTPISVGQRAKGERVYDWVLVRLGYEAAKKMSHFLM